MTSTIVIMAAGRGTRMQHLTAGGPKHLLPILGRPFLDYSIERIRQAGFTKIVICIGYKAEAFAAYRDVPDITLVEKPDNGRYGTATVIEVVRPVIGDQPFACIAGDNLYSVQDLRKVSTDTPTTWLGGFKTAAWQHVGILKLNEEGYLDRIIEKPTTFVGDMANASLYHFSPSIYQAVEQLQPSIRGEYEITDAINAVASKELVNVFELEDRWHELTAPEDIGKLERALQSSTT